MTGSTPLTPSVPPRQSQLVVGLLSDPLPIIFWLAMLTAHGEFVTGLGGNVRNGRLVEGGTAMKDDVISSDLLVRHIIELVQNLLAEMRGEDDPGTARALRQHNARGIFDQYPQAMRYVVLTLAEALYLKLRDKFPDIDPEVYSELEKALINFASRHGVDTTHPLGEFVHGINSEIGRIRNNGMLLTDDGATVFWDVVLNPATLQALGCSQSTPAETASLIRTIGMHLLTFMTDGLGSYYMREGDNRTAALLNSPQVATGTAYEEESGTQ